MPSLKTHLPKLCKHHKGYAFVKIGGQQIWLGRYGEPLTRERYDRLLAEWLANGRRLPQVDAQDPSHSPTLVELIAAYWCWAKERYTPAEIQTIRASLRIVERLYGSVAAAEFGPNALRTVRSEMIRTGWTRKQINRQISRVRALFRWSASHEMLPERIYNQLRTVEPLRAGEAPERPRVKPVPRQLIRAIRRRLPRPVRALVDLQLLTAARADELMSLRPQDIDQGSSVWVFNPEKHKTAHHGKERRIYFGPKSIRILKLLMRERPPEDFLFSPREAERERYARAKCHRRPDQKPNPRLTDRVLGEHYTTASYRRAIHRALADAFPPPPARERAELDKWRQNHIWGPHRLRHNAATFLRREFGIEVAQLVLGHSSSITTLIYAERDERRAMEAIAKVG